MVVGRSFGAAPFLRKKFCSDENRSEKSTRRFRADVQRVKTARIGARGLSKVGQRTLNASETMTTETHLDKPAPGLDDQLPDEMLPLPFQPWPEAGFRVLPCLRTGALLGGVAGSVSLLVNVIGSVAWPTISPPQLHSHPLQLIQVFLTFPLGDSAFTLDSGPLLALGCLLYLATGILYGVIFELAIAYFLPHAGGGTRFAFFSVLALGVWGVNFYGILSWLQPLLFGGRWIIDLIPWWVAAFTHLVFAWTMALIYPLAERGSAQSLHGVS
jgi:hypothetical protein